MREHTKKFCRWIYHKNIVIEQHMRKRKVTWLLLSVVLLDTLLLIVDAIHETCIEGFAICVIAFSSAFFLLYIFSINPTFFVADKKALIDYVKDLPLVAISAVCLSAFIVAILINIHPFVAKIHPYIKLIIEVILVLILRPFSWKNRRFG